MCTERKRACTLSKLSALLSAFFDTIQHSSTIDSAALKDYTLAILGVFTNRLRHNLTE